MCHPSNRNAIDRLIAQLNLMQLKMKKVVIKNDSIQLLKGKSTWKRTITPLLLYYSSYIVHARDR